MTAMGIELTGHSLIYVLVEKDADALTVRNSSKLELLDGRSPDSLRHFQTALVTILTEAHPDLIALKDKPQSGGMQAGAPAIKMEALLLMAAACEVRFTTGSAIKNCTATDGVLRKYEHPAYKAAAVELLKA